MRTEIKQCQNCKQDFTIEPDDFSFYEKMGVPAPLWCSRCRMMRRASFRNARSLYKRTCGLCHKTIISMFKPNDHAPVYCNSCWSSDAWDPYSYGMDIDWSRPFLTQWYELFQKTPRYALWHIPPLIDCEYTNYTINSKNCYLSFSITHECEDVRYCENIDKSIGCLDSLYLNESENCYENIDSVKNYNCRFALQSRECIESWFLFDCVNCQNCFMAANLRNKQYVFRGTQLTKYEYDEALEKEHTTSYAALEKLKSEFQKLVAHTALHKYADIVNSSSATGNHIVNSKNIRNSFGVSGCEDIQNGIRVLSGAKESRDVYGLGAGELIYDCMATSYSTYDCMFSFLCNTSVQHVRYTTFSLSSSYLFGCVGIRKGEYCILNKRYSKEEYELLIPRIIEHMNRLPYQDALGRIYPYGEFFPPEFSPHGYNEAVAYDLYPLKKHQALQQGYHWLEKEERTYAITKEVSDLPDVIDTVVDTIFGEIIACGHGGECDHKCATAFRILPEDLDFYRKLNLPLPRLCPNCRHYERLALREPVELWHRSCMCDLLNHDHHGRCENEFKTSYSPERSEKVYCEKCYQAEVL